MSKWIPVLCLLPFLSSFAAPPSKPDAGDPRPARCDAAFRREQALLRDLMANCPGGAKTSPACAAKDLTAFEAICYRLATCEGLIDQSVMRRTLKSVWGKECPAHPKA